MARIMVITNRKGGTGKTSTSVNLAAEFSARGKRVLLVDLDTQSHCAIGLGVRITKGTSTVHDLFTNGASLAAGIHTTNWPNLDLLPANPLFEHGSGDRKIDILKAALIQEGLHESYDLILIDTPPSHDVLLLNALHAADRVLVPFIPHFLAGEGVRQLARVLLRVAGTRTDKNLRVLGFLPVICDTRIGLHRETMGSIEHQFGASKMLPSIRNDIRVAESFAKGKPLRYFAPKSRAAEDYTSAVDAIIDKWSG